MDKKEYLRQYYLANREKCLARNRASAKRHRLLQLQTNPSAFKKANRIRKRKWDRKAMLDPLHRLSNNLRGNMYHALKAKKGFRKWEDLVGYTLQDLINHLTPLFTDSMAWENYGSIWHVDHVTPKSWFKYESTSDPKFKECWSLTNLQPKFKIDNIKKGNRFSG